MGVGIRAQLFSLLSALGAGAGLGLLYDLLRPVRRRSGDTLWDLLFCAAAAALWFLLAMREESGRLAGGQLLAGLTGFFLYLRLFSPFIFPYLERCAVFLLQIWKSSESCLKKIHFWGKKLFPNRRA